MSSKNPLEFWRVEDLLQRHVDMSSMSFLTIRMTASAVVQW